MEGPIFIRKGDILVKSVAEQLTESGFMVEKDRQALDPSHLSD